MILLENPENQDSDYISLALAALNVNDPSIRGVFISQLSVIERELPKFARLVWLAKAAMEADQQ